MTGRGPAAQHWSCTGTPLHPSVGNRHQQCRPWDQHGSSKGSDRVQARMRASELVLSTGSSRTHLETPAVALAHGRPVRSVPVTQLQHRVQVHPQHAALLCWSTT